MEIFKKVRIHLLLLFMTLFGGTYGYHLLYPEIPWSKLFFMTAITLSTVGYGDVLGVEDNLTATIYTIVLMGIGLSIVLYSISAITAFFVDGKLANHFTLKALKKRISKMKNHYIICGAGQTGIHVIREMYDTKQDFVVLESDERVITHLKELFTDINVLKADATNDNDLETANIESAAGFIATLASDKDNLFLVITARMKNPEIRITSKAVDLSIVDKLKKAGANYVVTPNFIGGMRMASEMIRPNVVTFLDKMIRGKDKSIRIGEVTIKYNSPLVNKNLSEVDTYKKCGVNILGYASHEDPETFIYNPSPGTTLSHKDILIFIGTEYQQKEMETLFQ